MPYVSRDRDGKINGVFEYATANAAERVTENDSELVEFLHQTQLAQNIQHLSATDSGMIRIIEDLVDVLIGKNVIMFTDLPLAAQQKFLTRKSVRDKLNTLDNLMVDNKDIL